MGFFNKKVTPENDKIIVDMTLGGTLRGAAILRDEPEQIMSLEEWIEMRKKEKEAKDAAIS